MVKPDAESKPGTPNRPKHGHLRRVASDTMNSEAESKEALGALEDLVRTAESIKNVAERERSQWRREDIAAVKEAREAYLRATEKIRHLARTAGLSNSAPPPPSGSPPRPPIKMTAPCLQRQRIA